MPTGYTAPVEDGTITEFKDFAIYCARAFGALITMREEPLGAPIPEAFDPSTYHKERMAEAATALAEANAMSLDEAARRSEDERTKAVEYVRQRNQQVVVENGRYDDMLAKVRRWNPPTSEHQGMKDFMIQQLEDSRSRFSDEPGDPLEPAAWLERHIAECERGVSYHAREWEAEQERAASRTAWVAALRASLEDFDG